MNDETKITVAKTTDTEFTFAESAGTVTNAMRFNVYICPDHGEVESCVGLFGPHGADEGQYCMECYKAHIRATCKPVLVDLGCEMRQVGHAQDTPMEPCLLAEFWRGVKTG